MRTHTYITAAFKAQITFWLTSRVPCVRQDQSNRMYTVIIYTYILGHSQLWPLLLSLAVEILL